MNLSDSVKTTVIISVIVFWLFTGCNQESQKSFKVIVTDTSITHRERNELYYSKLNAQLLNLPDITRGVDSFELRIWYWGFVGGTSLTDMRFVQNKWVIHRTEYFSSNQNLDSSITTNISAPKNIDQIIQYFTSDTLLQLPSQIAIPGFMDNIGDGQSVFIEIATNSFYKALDYHSPEHYSDKYHKYFMEALKVLGSLFLYSSWSKPHP